MDKILGIIHPGAKFVPVCGPVKLENKLSTSQIQGRTRDMITVINIPITKGKKEKEQGVTSPNQLQNPETKLSEISRPGNSALWLRGLPAGSTALLWSPCPCRPLFFCIVLLVSWRLIYVCAWVNSISPFLLQNFRSLKTSLSFCLISVPFSSNFVLIQHALKPNGSLLYAMQIHIVRQKGPAHIFPEITHLYSL